MFDGVSTARSRMLWTLADQTVSSLGNATLSVLVAHAVSSRSFGVFAVVFSAYGFILGIAQAIAGQVVAIRFSGSGRTSERAYENAAAAATGLGIACGVVITATAFFTSGTTRAALIVLGVFLPVVLLQDTWRAIFVVRMTPRDAFVNDCVWTVLQIALIAFLIHDAQSSPQWYLAAWGVTAVPAAALGVRQARLRPRITGTARFVMTHRGLSSSLFGQWVALLGCAQIAFVLIGALGGYSAVGAVRASQVLLGPLNILAFGLVMFAVPEISRTQTAPSRLVRLAVGMGCGLAALDLAWGLVLLLIPDSVGRTLLGPTWSGTQEVLPGMIVFTCCSALTVGCTAVFRALDRTVHALVLSAVLGPLILGMSVVGVRLDGGRGAAWGFALAAAVMIAPSWLVMRRAVRIGPRAGWPDEPRSVELPASR